MTVRPSHIVRGLNKNSIYYLPVQTLIFPGQSWLVFSASLFLSVFSIQSKKERGQWTVAVEKFHLQFLWFKDRNLCVILNKSCFRNHEVKPIDTFGKNAFFKGFLGIFTLDMSQISSNLLKKAFAIWLHAFLSTSIAF